MGSKVGDKDTVSASPSLHDLITIADIHSTYLSVTINSTVTMNPSSTMPKSDIRDDDNNIATYETPISQATGSTREISGRDRKSFSVPTRKNKIVCNPTAQGSSSSRTTSKTDSASVASKLSKASKASKASKQSEPRAQAQPYDLSDSRFFAVQDSAVYLAVHGRYTDGSFHCGLFIPILKAQNQGLGWYTDNAQGGWFVKLCSPTEVVFHRSLILLYKVGDVLRGKTASCQQRVRTLPADGHSTAVLRAADTTAPGRPVDTVARVKNAILTLTDEDLIALTTPVHELEARAFAIARQMEDEVKAGTRKAIVI